MRTLLLGLICACCLPHYKWEALQKLGTEQRVRGWLLARIHIRGALGRVGGQVGTANVMKHSDRPFRAKPLLW